ncbi:hypothetical protein F4804DRAFT_330546 [Jackrogersella minutella]|nr:hypothetical protein F4804DRAFT_330546 [Jackrogersella minutella]
MNGNSGYENDVGYLTRLESFHRLDQEREDMLKELIAKHQDLEQRFDRKCKEYDNEFQTRSLYQAQANEATKQLTDIQHRTEINSFVFAIIDGDGAVFREDWILKGEEGGAMAAHQLRLDIKKHLKEIYPHVNVDLWNIIVQLTLNLDGLTRKLYSVEFTRSLTELPAFARGFSRAHGLFSIIDVGKGKEQADFKVRETLRLMVHNLQCKHIIFGPCHDRGYIVELRPLQLETSISAKLSLLETTPAPRDFEELKFRRVQFNDVFRSELLPDGPPEPSVTLRSITPGKQRGFASAWSGAAPFIKQFKKLAVNTDKHQETREMCFDYYLVNSVGERVDEPIPPYDVAAEQRLQKRNEMERRGPCNRFHLNGHCDVMGCTYYHEERLGPAEQLVLRARARGSLCSHKTSCRNPGCFWGHHCKYNQNGQTCQRPNCIFTGTHYIDTKPAEKIWEDGSREKLSNKRLSL